MLASAAHTLKKKKREKKKERKKDKGKIVLDRHIKKKLTPFTKLTFKMYNPCKCKMHNNESPTG